MPVIGYEGFYEVSDLGQVRTVSRRVPTRGVNKTRQVNTRLLKPYADRWGYLRVSLSRGDNKAKSLKVHRLVAHAFIGAPPPSVPMFFTGMTFKQTTGVRIFGTAIVVTTSRMGFATGFFPTGEPVHLHG